MTAVEKAAKRDEILNLLTDAENAKVSTAEGGQNLKPDEFFVDLEQLDKGVQQGTATESVGHIIPKNAISAESWSKIVSALK